MTTRASSLTVPGVSEPNDVLGNRPNVLETHPAKKQRQIKTSQTKSEVACAHLDTHLGVSAAAMKLNAKGRLNKTSGDKELILGFWDSGPLMENGEADAEHSLGCLYVIKHRRIWKVLCVTAGNIVSRHEPWILSLCADSHCYAFDATIHVDTQPQMMNTSTAASHDVKSVSTKERILPGHLKMVHHQQLAYNAKDICLINTDNACDIAVAHSDRVVRLYTWCPTENRTVTTKDEVNRHGAFVILIKWELAGQDKELILGFWDSGPLMENGEADAEHSLGCLYVIKHRRIWKVNRELGMPWILSLCADSHCYAFDATIHVDTQPQMMNTSTAASHDVKSVSTKERILPGHLKMVHHQQLAYNAKDICLINTDNACDIAVAHSDRVVRLYTWCPTENRTVTTKDEVNRHGAFVILIKWELAGQVNRIDTHWTSKFGMLVNRIDTHWTSKFGMLLIASQPGGGFAVLQRKFEKYKDNIVPTLVYYPPGVANTRNLDARSWLVGNVRGRSTASTRPTAASSGGGQSTVDLVRPIVAVCMADGTVLFVDPAAEDAAERVLWCVQLYVRGELFGLSKLNLTAIDLTANMSCIPTWFPGCRLNYAENLLLAALPSEVAVYSFCEGQNQVFSLTYGKLREQVRAVAWALRESGVAVGDRVAGILPNGIEAVVCYLATAYIGAIWSSASPDFGVRGIIQRFSMVQPTVLFAVTRTRYRGKLFDQSAKLTELVQALEPKPHRVILLPYLGVFDDPCDSQPTNRVSHSGSAVGLHFVDENDYLHRRTEACMLLEPLVQQIPYSCTLAEFLRCTPCPCDIKPLQLSFSHPLVIMFTSGTTGPPKCILHSAGGTLIKHLCEQKLHCDFRPNDRILYLTNVSGVDRVMARRLAMTVRHILPSANLTISITQPCAHFIYKRETLRFHDSLYN
ncbi:hypothetical protein AHF37_01382 [Paragonimus kellicotti]|nr:hypothetical protein AHF37_01382 [Paragonimus kellicotti]